MPRRSPRSPLADVQSLMAHAVMRPLTRSEGMQTKWCDGSSAAQIADGFLKPNDRLSAFERLQIYNQQYWWRIQSAFAEDFRGLRAVLGERRFEKLSTAYLDHHGSASWTLRNLGSRLPEFVAKHAELTSPHHELALDMARVEWARVIAFDSEEKPRLDASKLEAIPASQLRLGLQPYLSLLQLTYPIDAVLRRLKRRTSIETASASNAVSASRPRARRRLTASAGSEPIHLAVHRLNYAVYYKRLEAPAYRLLCLLRDGAVLEVACEQAFKDSPDAPQVSAAKLREWFAEWMGFGWFV